MYMRKSFSDSLRGLVSWCVCTVFFLWGRGQVRSQLYSHWQEQHKGNPAARQLEDRWRLALKHPTKDKEWLDAKEIEGGYAQPLELSWEWMEQQGGVDQGYEQVRPPLAPDADEMFSTFNFKLHSDEHRAWLEAEGTL